jgi:hypothetical protein
VDRPIKTNVDFRNDKKIVNLPDPTDPQDAATKAYVDAHSGGGSTNKFSASVGDGVATSYDIVHSLGTVNVVITLLRVSDGAVMWTDMVALDANTVRLTFTNVPSAGQYTCIVVG